MIMYTAYLHLVALMNLNLIVKYTTVSSYASDYLQVETVSSNCFLSIARVRMKPLLQLPPRLSLNMLVRTLFLYGT